jgi:N-acetylglutamate synthase-like GNAT family acetyltransferase
MIKKAEAKDAQTLTQIALDAKRHWGYPESWIQHWKSDLTITPEFITHNHVYVAEDDGEVRGFYALCQNGDKAELEHMWVRPDLIGTGIGKELFLDAMERAAKMNVSGVELSADPNAAGFYERMGATKIGEVQSEIEGHARTIPRMKIDV